MTSKLLGKVTTLITAEEAFPALERLFIEAKTEVLAGFRVFDPETKLRSDAGRAIGRCWADLIEHTIVRGVAVRLILSDFDPKPGFELHRRTWSTIRRLTAVRELAGRDAAPLTLIPAMHPARTGILPRLMLWPAMFGKLRDGAKTLNEMSLPERTTALRELPALRDWLVEAADGRLRARRWPIPPLAQCTHHQKVAVADGRLLFIGGLDINERRYDTKEHRRPGRRTWHDVQLLIEGGEAPGLAERHLRTFLDQVAGIAAPGTVRPPFLRTISVRRRFDAPFLSPDCAVTEIADAHKRLIGETKKLIYFETQFFRDVRLARRLARAARREPGLRMIVMLPARPEDVAFEDSSGIDAKYGEHLQAKCIRILQKAFDERLFVGSPVQPRRKSGDGPDSLEHAPLIYIHAKVSVFDDRAAIVSSANLNGRSLSWDTEAGVELRSADAVELRRQCFTHWLPDGADDRFHAPDTAQQEWLALAEKNRLKDPEDRDGFIVPYSVASAEEFGMPVPGIPPESV